MSRTLLAGARWSCMVLLTASALVLQARPGLSQAPRAKERRSCANSYEKAQELRQASKLRRSREALIGCAKATCGDFVQRECAKWLGQVDAEMPSLVFVAKDDLGVPVVEIDVAVDGEELTSRLDGRAIAVDPGMHDFSFKTANGAILERQIAIAQGERNRIITIDVSAARLPAAPAQAKAAALDTMAAPPAPPAKVQAKVAAPPAAATASTSASRPAPASGTAPAPRVSAAVATTPATSNEAPAPASSRSDGGSFSSVAPYLVGSVGVLGLGGYALLYSIAKSDNNSLSECWPTCTDTRLDRIRHLYLAADISLGVGAAAIGTATFLFLSRSSGERSTTTGSAKYVVGVNPSRSGMLASVSGVF